MLLSDASTDTHHGDVVTVQQTPAGKLRSLSPESSPIVSVIIPTYRRTHYLGQALRSVLAQTYSVFEVIVVEDGTADGAAALVESCGDPRVRYIWQQHAGRSAARNLGMQVAQGGYIAFLDDDDLYLPTKLASQVAFLERNPDVYLVGSGAQIIDQEGEAQGQWRPWLDLPKLTLQTCLYSCPLTPSTVLLRRQILDHLVEWFDPEMDLAEDTDFFIHLLHVGCHMAWLPELLSAYRVHGGGSQGDGARYSRATQRILDKLFAQPDLPSEIVVQKAQLYAHYHLVGACFSYATGHVPAAQSDLEQALTLQPQLAEGELPRVAAQVAGFANTFRVSEPKAYIDYVFDHLPPSLSHLARYRREAHSAFHMGRVFSAQRAGEHISLRDWLEGIWQAPRWLRNRGVWSIFGQAVLGRTVYNYLRSLRQGTDSRGI